MAAASGAAPGEEGKVPCPACTFLNPVDAVVCEMCETPLPAMRGSRKREAEDVGFRPVESFLDLPPDKVVAQEAKRLRIAGAPHLRRLGAQLQERARRIAEMLEREAESMASRPAHITARNADDAFSTVRLWSDGPAKGAPSFVANGTRLEVVGAEGDWFVVEHEGQEWWVRAGNVETPAAEEPPVAEPLRSGEAAASSADVAVAAAAAAHAASSADVAVAAVAHVPVAADVAVAAVATVAEECGDLVFFTKGIDRGSAAHAYGALVRAAQFRILRQEPDPRNSSKREWDMGERFEHCGFERVAGCVTMATMGLARLPVRVEVAYEIDAGDCAGARYRVTRDGTDVSLLYSETGLAEDSELAIFAVSAGLMTSALLSDTERRRLHLLFLDIVWTCFDKGRALHVRQEDLEICLSENLAELVPDLLEPSELELDLLDPPAAT